MNKSTVLQGLNQISIQQAAEMSLININGNNMYILVVKSKDGEGYPLQIWDLILYFIALDIDDQSWVIEQFNKVSDTQKMCVIRG